MTLIIGARCNDGVVLIGDRKVSGSLQQYTNKIRKLGQADWIIFSAAGMEALFKEFLEEVEKEYLFILSVRDAQRITNPDIPIPPFTLNDFKHICAKTAKRLKKVYSELGKDTPFQFRLQVLFVAYELVGTKRKASLFYLDMHDCFPYPQEEGKIVEIGQPDLGKIFLTSYKNGNFTMKDIARLGSFVIKYVEKEKLSYEEDTFGVGDGQPQIWFYPDSDTEAKAYEIQEKDLEKLLEGIDAEVEKVRKQIGSKSTFLKS
jgi:hypothetical protein